jgi:hypothetical protein
VPTVPRRQAACNLIAANEPNNFQVLYLLRSGSTLALGRVSVAPRVRHRATFDGTSKTGRPDRYHDRLAWILTVSFAPPSSCPVAGSHTAARLAARRKLWDYEIFAIDAHTGASAITYVERRRNSCGSPGTQPPFVSVPAESLSVPWRLDHLSANRRSGGITVYYASCPDESADLDVWVSRHTRTVEVLARRSFGPPCSEVRAHHAWLHPPTVTTRIPRHLRHERTGPIDWPRVD